MRTASNLSTLGIAVARLRGHNDALSGQPPQFPNEPAYMAGYAKGEEARTSSQRRIRT